jgi:hypothetical protein
MGASLSYRPEPNPPDLIADLIIKEASALSRIANHWCEPYFFMRGTGGKLTGFTKVSLPGFTVPDGAYVSVDPSDDMFMMAQEIEMLLRGISIWARGYKLKWHIAFAGASVGSIDSTGAYSEDLRSFLAELHMAAATPTDPEELKSTVSRLRLKYAQRNQ